MFSYYVALLAVASQCGVSWVQLSTIKALFGLIVINNIQYIFAAAGDKDQASFATFPAELWSRWAECACLRK